MKKAFTLVFLSLVGMVGLMGQTDSRAKTILDELSQKTRASTGLMASFSMTMENKTEDINETYEGNLWLRGNKYKVSLMGVDTYYDGQTRWTHMVEEEEVTVSVPEEGEDEMDPATLFTIYEKGFKYQLVEEKNQGSQTFFVIDLFPEDRDKSFFKIQLLINKSRMQFDTIKTFGKDGSHYIVKVKEMKENVNLSQETFVFYPEKHPDVEVVDMR